MFEKENRIAGKLLAFRSVIKVWRFNAKMFFITIDTFTKLHLKVYYYPSVCLKIIDCQKKVSEINKSLLLVVYEIINSLL